MSDFTNDSSGPSAEELTAALLEAAPEEAPADQPQTGNNAASPDPGQLLGGRFENSADGIAQLETHAKYQQSEADRQRMRADQVELSHKAIMSSEAGQLLMTLKDNPELLNRIKREAQRGLEKPPEEFDVSDIHNAETESGKWFQARLERQAETIADRKIKELESRLGQRDTVSQLLRDHPELEDQARRDELKSYIEQKAQSGGITEADMYRLYLVDNGIDPRAARNSGSGVNGAQPPTGIGGAPGRQEAMTDEASEMIQIIQAGFGPSGFMK